MGAYANFDKLVPMDIGYCHKLGHSSLYTKSKCKTADSQPPFARRVICASGRAAPPATAGRLSVWSDALATMSDERRRGEYSRAHIQIHLD